MANNAAAPRRRYIPGNDADQFEREHGYPYILAQFHFQYEKAMADLKVTQDKMANRIDNLREIASMNDEMAELTRMYDSLKTEEPQFRRQLQELVQLKNEQEDDYMKRTQKARDILGALHSEFKPLLDERLTDLTRDNIRLGNENLQLREAVSSRMGAEHLSRELKEWLETRQTVPAQDTQTEEMVAEISTLKTDKTRLVEDLAEANKSVQSGLSKLNDKQDAYNQELTRLSDRIYDSSTELANLRTEHNALKDAKKLTETSLNDLEQKFQELTEKTTANALELNTLQADYDTVKSEKESLGKVIENKDATIAAQDSRIQELEARPAISELNRQWLDNLEVQNYKRARDNANEIKDDAISNLNMVNLELSSMRKRMGEAKNKSLTAEKEFRGKIRELDAKVMELKAEKDPLEQQLQEFQKQIKEYGDANKELRNQNLILNTDLDNEKQTNIDDAALHNTKISQFEAEILELKSRALAAEKDRNIQVEQNTMLLKREMVTARQVVNLESENRWNKKFTDSLQKQLENQESSSVQLQQVRESHKQELQDLRDSHQESLYKRDQDHDLEMKELQKANRDELAVAQRKLRTKEIELDDLQRQHDISLLEHADELNTANADSKAEVADAQRRFEESADSRVESLRRGYDAKFSGLQREYDNRIRAEQLSLKVKEMEFRDKLEGKDLQYLTQLSACRDNYEQRLKDQKKNSSDELTKHQYSSNEVIGALQDKLREKDKLIKLERRSAERFKQFYDEQTSKVKVAADRKVVTDLEAERDRLWQELKANQIQGSTTDKINQLIQGVLANQDQANRYQATIDAKEEELSKQRREFNESIVQSNKEAQKSVRTMKERLDQLRDQLDEAQDEIKAFKSQVAALNAEHKGCAALKESMENHIKTLDATISDLRTDKAKMVAPDVFQKAVDERRALEDFKDNIEALMRLHTDRPDPRQYSPEQISQDLQDLINQYEERGREIGLMKQAAQRALLAAFGYQGTKEYKSQYGQPPQQPEQPHIPEDRDVSMASEGSEQLGHGEREPQDQMGDEMDISFQNPQTPPPPQPPQLPPPAAPPRRYEFLISGTPRDGPRTSNGPASVVAKADALIRGWEDKNYSWDQQSQGANQYRRCIETRRKRIGEKRNPIPNEGHTVACKICTKNKQPCMIIGNDFGPVILPLAENKKSAQSPIEEGYYTQV